MLCRLDEGNPTSVLAINRRYTYAFVDFLYGRYSKRDGNALTRLIDNMTVSEALDIMSLDFPRMWYRVWLDAPKKDYYEKRLACFKMEYLSDNGAKLKKIIRGAHPMGTPRWEIPKGHKRDRDESDIMCAMREFKEETGICKRDYRIVPDAQRKMKYISTGVEYTHIYFVAICARNVTPERLSLRQPGLVAEASLSRWLTIADLKVLDPSNRIANEFKPITRMLKNLNRCPSGIRIKRDENGATQYSPTINKKSKWVGPSFIVGVKQPNTKRKNRGTRSKRA
jgi:8-oxo-dGTP pyrophosphatase MutT (NUDIX family)